MSEFSEKRSGTHQLYEALKAADIYPHHPDSVEHVQTHISHVYIVPPYVYKIKKAVDFGFLDFSTLEKRRHYCEQEVTLNSRLCSDIYLGVIPISSKNGAFLLDEDSEGEVVEYAVKMNKLDEQYFLHSYIENDRLEKTHFDRVGQKLAAFYQNQSPGDQATEFGTIERIKYNTDENFEQTRDFIGDTIERESYKAIRYYTNQFFEQNADLFRQRIENGCIIDGHGDLHLEHIHITPESVCIYDCIEFNERLRYGDWAVDLAFLAMDLDFNACWNWERYLVKLMEQKLSDDSLSDIIDFYKCYRAYVKGKVKSLHSSEEEVDEQERRRMHELAIRYFNLSLRYALIGSKPQVLIFMGGVATGKSSLAEHLSERIEVEHISSDVLRKSLADLPLHERTPKEKRSDLYSSEMSEKVYKALFEKAKNSFNNEESVILDATFSSENIRKTFKEKLKDLGANYLFIEAEAPDDIIKKRLQERAEQSDIVSDARAEDFEMLNNRYEAPGNKLRNNFISVDTGQEWSDTIEELYKKLADRQVQVFS